MRSKLTTKRPRSRKLHAACLLLGSNVGDRKTWLAFARKAITEKIGDIARHSKLYETAPWGKIDQQAFINQALQVKTKLDPSAVLQEIRIIEEIAGRQRSITWGPRTLDIDILLYDDLILHTDELTIPHAQMSSRRFVLVPLSEIAGEAIHPVSRKSISALLAECPDQSEVAILAEG